MEVMFSTVLQITECTYSKLSCLQSNFNYRIPLFSVMTLIDLKHVVLSLKTLSCNTRGSHLCRISHSSALFPSLGSTAEPQEQEGASSNERDAQTLQQPQLHCQLQHRAPPHPHPQHLFKHCRHLMFCSTSQYRSEYL